MPTPSLKGLHNFDHTRAVAGNHLGWHSSTPSRYTDCLIPGSGNHALSWCQCSNQRHNGDVAGHCYVCPTYQSRLCEHLRGAPARVHDEFQGAPAAQATTHATYASGYIGRGCEKGLPLPHGTVSLSFMPNSSKSSVDSTMRTLISSR
eukprot:2535038-Amphidinium_carterae.2